MNWTERITIEPGNCDGRPCIRGLPIRVTDVLGLLATGASHEKILEDYPDLEEADISAALGYAATQTDKPVNSHGLVAGSFRPRPLRNREARASLSNLSGNYFKAANEFRAMAVTEGSRWPGHFYVFPAVTMYVASFEAFLQEHLALYRFHLERSDDARKATHIERINALKAQQKPYRSFKEWVKGVYRLFDSKDVGLDTTCDEYQNLLALKELRNSIVHYNPAFIEYALWPANLERALQCSKIEVRNADWVSSFMRVEIADWAHETIRAAIELFCGISGVENPFTTTQADGMLNWESTKTGP